MGLRMRKSVNLGCGFRVNVSKSGIGYSWGIPGYRITKTSKGNTRKTYSIPGTGLSYVDETSKHTNKPASKNVPQSSRENTRESTPTTNIDITNISELQPANFSDLTRSIRTCLIMNKIFNYMCVGLIGVPIFNIPLVLIGLAGVIGKVYTKNKKTPYIQYEIDESSNIQYQNVVASIKNLSTCKRIWHINTAQYVTNKKVNAGASRNVGRKPFIIQSHLPKTIKSNIDGIRMKLGKKQLIFLPDTILILQGCKVGAAAYKDLTITQSYTHFIESEKVPPDSEVVDYTWQYVNKNGSADKRFKNNRRLPICKYGNLRFADGKNLNIELMCSDYSKSQIFSDEFLKHA